MVSFCKKVVWLIRAPVAVNSTRFWLPRRRRGRMCPHSTAAQQPGRSRRFYALLVCIEQDAPAVHMVFDQQAFCGQQLPQQLTAHLPKVAGIDAVELLRFGAGILKIVQQGGSRCRGHGSPHIVDVLYLIILHTAKGGSGNANAFALRLQRQHPAAVAVHWAVGVRTAP